MGGGGVEYPVTDKPKSAGKRALIVGGGDSALDWVVNLHDTAAGVTLVHRRDAFRAHEATVSDVQRLAQTGRVDVKTPYVIREVIHNGHLQGVRVARPDGDASEFLSAMPCCCSSGS